MTDHNNKGNGVGAKFWIPLFVTSMLTVAMGTWALSERAMNLRAIEDIKENKTEIKVNAGRDVTQDRQIALIMQRLESQHEDIADTLRMFKKHLELE